jgi:hypothetical protein
MRTTLTLDEDIARRLQAESLAQSGVLKSMSPFRVAAADFGGPAGSGSYDNIEALLEESEGVEHR